MEQVHSRIKCFVQPSLRVAVLNLFTLFFAFLILFLFSFFFRINIAGNSHIEGSGSNKIMVNNVMETSKESTCQSSSTSALRLLCGLNENRRKGYQCIVCDECFEERENFRSHVRQHINSDNTGSRYQINFPVSEPQTMLIKYNNKAQGSVFSTKRENIVVSSDDNCEFNNRILSLVSTEYADEDESADVKYIGNFLCEQCGMSFGTDLLLNQHVKSTHTWV